MSDRSTDRRTKDDAASRVGGGVLFGRAWRAQWVIAQTAVLIPTP